MQIILPMDLPVSCLLLFSFSFCVRIKTVSIQKQCIDYNTLSLNFIIGWLHSGTHFSRKYITNKPSRTIHNSYKSSSGLPIIQLVWTINTDIAHPASHFRSIIWRKSAVFFNVNLNDVIHLHVCDVMLCTIMWQSISIRSKRRV